MNFPKTAKDQSGFSLIELMVVVAIIALLAAVAVPQFNKVLSRAKQAEAHSMLASIFTAETAFFAQYNTYYHGLLTIGFSPIGRIRYNAGFASESTVVPGEFGFATVGTDISQINAAGWCSASCPAMTNGCCLLPESKTASLPAVGVATWGVINRAATTFKAGAASHIYKPNQPDEWSIDNNKLITQVRNGIF